MPTAFEVRIPDDQRLRYHMADKMGDMLWFGVDIVNTQQEQVVDICNRALETHVGRVATLFTTFDEQQQAVTDHAPQIAVGNKLGLLGRKIAPELTLTTLQDHPGYVFLRVVQRLIRSLQQGHKDLMPPTAAELEAVMPPDQATGDFLNVLAYIAQNRLQLNMQSIAHFNMDKLEHRKIHGKANDIEFNDGYASVLPK